MGESTLKKPDPPVVALLPEPPLSNSEFSPVRAVNPGGDESPLETPTPAGGLNPRRQSQVDFSAGAAASDGNPTGSHLVDSGLPSDISVPDGVVPGDDGSLGVSSRPWWLRLLTGPWYVVRGLAAVGCLLILIAIVAAIPLLQFASLGYLLAAAARLADRQPLTGCLPGLHKAGKIGGFALFSAALYLPVLLLVDLAYSAELLQPNSPHSIRWRLAALIASAFWLTHVAWAAYRGGWWWQLLWPAPLKFLKEFWRPRTWRQASDQFYDWVVSLQIPRLWWLGARATLAALLWLSIPVSLMIIGQRAQELPVAPLLGLVGAVGLTWLMFHLPFMQIEFARTNRFLSLFELKPVRRQYRLAPIVHALALVALCLLAIPLYVLKIEATPEDLVWLPSVVFVSLMLPAKLLLGWAMGRAEGRLKCGLPIRHLGLRLAGRLLGLVGVLLYVGALYVAQLVAGQGAIVMYFQHVFLAPNPLFVS